MKVNAYINLIKKILLITSFVIGGRYLSLLYSFFKKPGTLGGNPKKEKRNLLFPQNRYYSTPNSLLFVKRSWNQSWHHYFSSFCLSLPLVFLFSNRKWGDHICSWKRWSSFVPRTHSHFAKYLLYFTSFALISQILLFHKSPYIFLCHKSPLQ